MSPTEPQFWVALSQIIVIDILLSGDNAVVIALAARTLPDRERKMAIVCGTAGAVVMRVLFATVIVYLLEIPYLKLIGGVLLLWIAVKLLIPEANRSEDGSRIKPSTTLVGAIGTIMVADAVMSLDNVIGIAAASKGHVGLLAVGLAISIPLVVYGSTIMLRLLDRYPILIGAGGALLGWIGGDIGFSDPTLAPWTDDLAPFWHHATAVACAVGVVVVGLGLRRHIAQRRKALNIVG